MSYFRPSVEQMQGYVPGEQPAAEARVVKLNTNENPYPPSPRVREAIVEELGDASRLRLYSDPAALRLRRAAAARFGLPVANILHGNGSDELLALLFRAFVETGESVAYPYPTYTLYDTLAAASGARVERSDFEPEFRLPTALFGSRAKLVFIANPNAPTGTFQGIDQLEELARSLPNGLVVVDEAYGDFAPDSALRLVPRVPNLVVIRTFSKSHSLAGMRLGLLFAPEPIVAGLNKLKDSYNLDRLAIVAGAASLEDEEWTRQNVARICATRDRLSQQLTALGVSVVPSHANFVLARLSSAARARGAYEALKQQGILVRYFPVRLLDDALRITIGTDAEIDVFLAALGRYLATTP